jgi:hypothetical protein
VAGHSVSLVATVRNASSGAVPTGTVTFVDGSRVLGTVAVDARGRATLRLSTTNSSSATARAIALGVGTHHILAVYHGDATHNGSESAGAALVVQPVVMPTGDGPRVTGVLRYGYHLQPTVLVVQFNRALDPATVANLSNYTIINRGGPGRGGTRVGQVIQVAKAVYDAAHFRVILYPAQRLDIHNRYALIVQGASPGGLADTAGRRLDGLDNGKVGSNFVSLITRQTLAGPTSASGAILAASRPAPAAAVAPVSAPAVDLLLARLGALPLRPRARRGRRH